MLRARPVVSSILNRVRVPLLPQNCALCSNWMSHVTSRCFGHCALLHVAPVIVAHQARAAKIVEVDAVEAGVGVCDEVRAHLQHALVAAHGAGCCWRAWRAVRETRLLPQNDLTKRVVLFSEREMFDP